MILAPGPKGSLILGSLAPFRADTLGFLGNAVRDYGDVIRMRFGHVTTHLVNHPDHIHHVLSHNAANYDKTTRSAVRIAATTGDSLLSANQAAWKRHRRLIQPNFQPRNFENITPTIDVLLTPMLDRWRRDGTVNIVDEIMQLVIASVVRILFSSDVDPNRISEPLKVILIDTWRRIEAPFDASQISPRFHRPAFKRAVAQIDAIVLDLIQTRRKTKNRPDDVLTRLLSAHEIEGEAQLTDTELRDATVTLLLAGHETTANAISWALIHASDGFETTNPAHIFAEALRMYPSIWVIERRALKDDTIGGYHIPRGATVLISPYLLHRREDFWPDPDIFDPSRFAVDYARPRLSYLPWGHGPHRCVGIHLAQTMAVHIIGRVLAQVDLRLLPDQSLGSTAGITLEPAGPIWMQVATVGKWLANQSADTTSNIPII